MSSGRGKRTRVTILRMLVGRVNSICIEYLKLGILIDTELLLAN